MIHYYLSVQLSWSCQTFFEIVKLEPVVGPFVADHHGEGKHHLGRVDLVDRHDVQRKGDGDR